jgi:hypothetical protein
MQNLHYTNAAFPFQALLGRDHRYHVAARRARSDFGLTAAHNRSNFRAKLGE